MAHPLAKRLGRIAKIDPRDHAYLIRSLIPTKPKIKRKHWSVTNNEVWDQGDTPQCTSYAANLLLVSTPVRNVRWRSDLPLKEGLEEFYNLEQGLDGIPVPHEGSTVRAAMQLLQSHGYIKNYFWEFSVEGMAMAILSKGPVDLGIDWTTPMFDPDPKTHFIQVSPGDDDYDVVGGHSLLALGVDTTEKCPDGSTGSFTLQNSWGKDWGDRGQCKISWKDMAILLNNQGEAAQAPELLHKGK